MRRRRYNRYSNGARFFLYVFPIALILLPSCGSHRVKKDEPLMSVQIFDRNGFQETIGSTDRLASYEKTDFLAPQPYKKVTRIFRRNGEGKTCAKLTTYHENGEIWQYLEVVNGRACGTYREWHDNGQLRLEVTVIEGIGELHEGAQQGWLFDGLSRAWSDSGALQAEIYYEKGRLQGNALYYYPSGGIEKVIPYENDQIHGLLLQYNLQGNLIGKTLYVQGKRQGLSIFQGDQHHPPYTEEYRDDLLFRAIYHDFSGAVLGQVEGGSGRQVIFSQGTVQLIREYHQGRPEGEIVRFNARGELLAKMHLKNGMKHGGEWVYYSPLAAGQEPQPKLYVEWVEGVVQGVCRTWYPEGVLESEREIRENKKHGIASAWYQDGSLMMLEEYENDQLCNGKYLKRGETRPLSTVEKGEGTATLHDAEGVFIRRIVYHKGLPVDEL